MAPVQNEHACEVKAPSSEVKCCHCGGSKSSWDMFLPITQRGSFFQDSFFSNIQQHFHDAVREVLDQWSGSDLRLTDRMDDTNVRHGDALGRYRRLRSIDLKEENQAVTVTSDDTSHKVVLDVHEFLGGDVRVKAVGERELEVEGRVDRKEEGSPCVTSHNFRRRFFLPRRTDMTAITSAMSSDGVLTITVPKLENEDHQKTTIIPIKVEETQRNSQTNASMTSEPQATHKQESKCKHCSREVACNKESVSNKAVSAFSDSEKRSSAIDSFVGHNFFPIVRRGLFFDDSFFQESWKDFQRAVKEVLNKWGEQSSIGDDLTRYRSLRSRDLREENQAVTSSEDERQHKFVLDVKDFSDGGEISVKAVNDRELVVEGRKEKQGDGSRCSQRFLRRFVVPGDLQLDAVNSVVSSDGVLTISAPKKARLQIREVPVPIQNEGQKTGASGTAMNNADKSNDASAATIPKSQNESHISSGVSTPSKASSQTNSTRGSHELSSSNQKGDSQQNTTVIPVRVQETGRLSEKPTSSCSKTSTGVGDEDASSRSTSFAARGKGGDADEGDQQDEDLYKLKGNGANFPIKINGSVINNNSL
ncbi:LOW QUALITY PROTEIN: uncharacterized protein LOC119574197 [Penaeus monodon]|uniref:LOW QUALITY PROTEIN: uncharacterized protein LOC119574197 n=1 Tax=Penaeus monodon TaxID=6687 RepID=UPI0018A706BB|nr:LOW QUALITY PROTEIN: uncharacterized protein LOC119574197 [Penaeus monodon]